MVLCQQCTNTPAVGSGRKLQRDAKRRQNGRRRPEAERRCGATWRRERPPLSHDDDPIVDRPNGNVLEPEVTRDVKYDRKFEARFVPSDDRKVDASGGDVVERHFRPGRRPLPDAEDAVDAEIGDETSRLGTGGQRRLVEDSDLTGTPGDGLHRHQKAVSVFADADDQVFCPVRGHSDANACGGRVRRGAGLIEGSR